MGYWEAEQDHLYGGGIQTDEEFAVCAVCNEEVGADALEIGGELFCPECYAKMVRSARERLRSYFEYWDAPVEKKALAEAMTDFIEEELEDW